MIETPFFFQNRSYNLFGVLHEPVNQKKRLGFVFVHPFAEEKLWTHRVYVNFARELASTGYPVLRFDIMGHGDSDGDFIETSIDTQLSDIQSALNTLKHKASYVTEFGLLGLRLGGTLAAVSAEKVPDIKKLILWDPVVDGSKYMQEMLRINLTTQTAVYKEIRHTREDLVQMMKVGKPVNIDGYEISYPFFEQASSINLAHDKKNFSGNCLIVQMSKKETGFNKDLDNLKLLYSKADLLLSIEEPFWKEIKTFYSRAENLYNNTLNWLETNQ